MTWFDNKQNTVFPATSGQEFNDVDLANIWQAITSLTTALKGTTKLSFSVTGVVSGVLPNSIITFDLNFLNTKFPPGSNILITVLGASYIHQTNAATPLAQKLNTTLITPNYIANTLDVLPAVAGSQIKIVNKSINTNTLTVTAVPTAPFIGITTSLNIPPIVAELPFLPPNGVIIFGAGGDGVFSNAIPNYPTMIIQVDLMTV